MRFCTDELNVQVAAVNVNVHAYCNVETQQTAVAAVGVRRGLRKSQPY